MKVRTMMGESGQNWSKQKPPGGWYMFGSTPVNKSATLPEMVVL